MLQSPTQSVELKYSLQSSPPRDCLDGRRRAGPHVVQRFHCIHRGLEGVLEEVVSLLPIAEHNIWEQY